MRLLIPLFVLSLVATSCTNSKSEEKDPKPNDYLLEAITPDSSKIYFTNTIIEDPEHSIINYIYYYNGAGVAAGDVNNDGLPDLYFVGNSVPNKLYLNKGNFVFEDVSEKSKTGGKASWQTGATMVDINKDGWLDIYVSAVSGLLDFTGHNELYINNQDGTFTEASKDYGLDIRSYATQAYFFDYDKDDDLDVYIVNHSVHTTYSYGPAETRKNRQPLVGDLLLRNNAGKFEDVSEIANIYGGANNYGLSASLADFNNDGWTDIYVCNDFHENDYYYINNQDGTFSEKIDEAFSIISNFSMGSDAADINGDGLPDLITLDMLPEDERILKETEGDDAMYYIQQRLRKLGYKDQFARNMLQINNNNGKHFTEKALLDGVAASDWSWAALFADFNNDSHQDLFITNGILRRPNDLDFKKYVANAFKGRSKEDGLTWLYRSIDSMPEGKVANKIFEGNSASFKNQTGSWITEEPGLSNGALYVDLDMDGNLDLVANNLNAPASIYRNRNNTPNNFIALKLNYLDSNPEGIGTTAKIHSGSKVQTRSLYKSRGFLSATTGDLHFGLGQNDQIDSLIVIWPNLRKQVIRDLKINQKHEIAYQENLPTYQFNKGADTKPLFTRSQEIAFSHKEDSYNDFLNEKLIPYKVSTLGPAVAIGDVDGNGFDDLYLGGASGSAGSFYINTGKQLIATPVDAFNKDSIYEDNTASFFDADGDGDLDLYVGSGLNKNNQGKSSDRLYLYEGKEFLLSSGAVPENNLITSIVTTNDFDHDGDMDLFIGNLTAAHHFGSTVGSYILVNDGRGKFSKLKEFELHTKVNDALWQDVNLDGRADLVVATEWDSPKIFLNTRGGLFLQNIPSNLNGLWQSVGIFDIDQDGDEDILLGNWGENSKFNPSPEAPLRMYYMDFDKNRKTETILAYKKGDSYYPVHSKDELASQLTVIKKRYVRHADYAMKTMEEIFTPYTLGQAQLNEVHVLSSGYLENNNGEFNRFIKFPSPLQLAPINTFKKISLNRKESVLVGGNSFRSNNYQGTHSALQGYMIKHIDTLVPVSHVGVKEFKNEVKAIEEVRFEDHRQLLIINNDAPLEMYSYEN